MAELEKETHEANDNGSISPSPKDTVENLASKSEDLGEKAPSEPQIGESMNKAEPGYPKGVVVALVMLSLYLATLLMAIVGSPISV